MSKKNPHVKFRTRTNKQGVAIKGYDPVAYFTVGAPTKGSPDITYQWADAEWHFSNQDNRQAFIADPLTYAPQFGGNCAVAAATGHRVSGSPKRWRIEEDGLLYLNKDRFASLLHGPLSNRIRRLSSELRASRPSASVGAEPPAAVSPSASVSPPAPVSPSAPVSAG